MERPEQPVEIPAPAKRAFDDLEFEVKFTGVAHDPSREAGKDSNGA